MNYAETLGSRAKACRKAAATASTAEKNAALAAISAALREGVDIILDANNADLIAARENGMSEAMQDRLRLTADRINGIADGVDDVIKLEDPIGEVISGSVRPNGMSITKVRVPLGTIAIIF